MYPWQSIFDFGETILNSAGYQSLDGDLATGRSDDGGTIRESAMMTDLDQNGSNGEGDKSFMYAEVQVQFTPVTAAEMGFSKRVKTPTDTAYSTTTTTVSSGSYSYQLRYGLGENASAKDVVIYDVFEVAQPSQTNRWKGTFTGLDISQITAKGIDAKVYYSTSTSFGDLATDANLTDLSNTALWSTSAPSDLSTVTAIAIDCSTKTDGTPYEFGSREVALAYVYMEAPEQVDDYLDDPDTTVDEGSYAYNSAYVHTVTRRDGVETEATEECPSTTVGLRAPEASIQKTSDVATGSKESPAVVQDGETLTYHVLVSNDETAITLHDVIVEDTIPTGLLMDEENITYTVNGTSTKVSELDAN